ncbi:hypothetical protein SteCoe_28182 [Stentor coeruleus]|uniref:Uncharacterized protein n=1 Tax=Stentor coeruleus TaxID=5963 RepID=A0A1R2B8R8_9CILI|nr:hypothetical protein SteCoe_28182 [Stentor coeruleus]
MDLFQKFKGLGKIPESFEEKKDPQKGLICENLILRMRIKKRKQEIVELKNKLEDLYKYNTELKEQAISEESLGEADQEGVLDPGLQEHNQEFFNAFEENIKEISSVLKSRSSFKSYIKLQLTKISTLEMALIFFIGALLSAIIFPQAKAHY